MTASRGRGSAGNVTCSPRAMRVAVHAATAASRMSWAATSPASRRSGILIPARRRSRSRSRWPFHVRFPNASGPPASTANETSGWTSPTRGSRTRSTSRIAVRSAQPCAEVLGAIARASLYVRTSSATRDGVKKMLERLAPTAARASRSARRLAPGSGRPIGMSTPTTTASANRSSSAGKRRSRTASANRPCSSATAIQPPRAASTPSVSTWTDTDPDQVAVRKQEAECQQRQSRQTAAPGRGEGERPPERQRHQQPRQSRPQRKPRGRGEEQREEEEIRQAEIGLAASSGNRKGKRERREHLLVLLHDHIGGPLRGEHRVRIDPGDDQRDEHDPAEGLEVAEEPEADRGDPEELAEVLGRAPTDEVEQERQQCERDRRRDRPTPRPERQHQPDEREGGRDQHRRDERDVPPRRRLPQPIVERVVESERRAES